MKLDDVLKGSYQRYIASDFLAALFFDKRIPLVIDGVIDGALMQKISLKLLDCYGDVALTVEEDGKERTCAVSELKGEADTLIIDGCPLTECKRFGFSDFVELMKRLRAPDGCE